MSSFSRTSYASSFAPPTGCWLWCGSEVRPGTNIHDGAQESLNVVFAAFTHRLRQCVRRATRSVSSLGACASRASEVGEDLVVDLVERFDEGFVASSGEHLDASVGNRGDDRAGVAGCEHAVVVAMYHEGRS